MITETLRQIPLFAGLTEEQLQYVQQGNEIRLRPGEYVKRAGEPPEGFYIVIEGQVEWTSRVGQQDVYVLTLADGEFWGHELLLTDNPYPVSGRALNEVWTNLMDNAIDAVGGSGRIWIRTSREPGRLLVEIADDGPGVPEDARPHVFEPFFTTKDVGEGTGLGLDIARRIVAGNHKGDIRLLSRPGDTRFQVRLPM
jgi:signal transduction histidine kinase